MATLDLTVRDFGYNQVNVNGADLYDFRGSNVNVEQCRLNTAIRVTSSPDGARWLGGRVEGTNSFDKEWTELHSCNGAGMLIEGSRDFTVEGIYIFHPFDGIRPGSGTTNLSLERVWIAHARDDAVEADHRGDIKRVTIRRSFFEEVHTFISSRRGKPQTGATPHVRLEVEGCLMSLGNHLDRREKRKYAWNRTDYGSGQPWKTEATGTNTTILLKDNVFRMDRLPKSAKSTHRMVPSNATLDPASGGNVFVWTGGTPANVEMVTVNGVRVPETLGLHELTGIFTVTDDPRVWDEAVAAWIAEVWEGEPGAPDPIPDPEPEPEPGPDTWRVVPHDPAWQLAEGAILVEFRADDAEGSRQGVFSKDAAEWSSPNHVAWYVENGQLRTRRQAQPDQSYILSVPIQSDVDYEVIMTFGPEGSKVYVDRVLVAEDQIAWSLLGNTEWLVIGALGWGSTPGTVDDIKRPFGGTVDVVEFLTRAEADALLNPPGPEPEPEPDPRIAELQVLLTAIRDKAAELTGDLDSALQLLDEES